MHRNEFVHHICIMISSIFLNLIKNLYDLQILDNLKTSSDEYQALVTLKKHQGINPVETLNPHNAHNNYTNLFPEKVFVTLCQLMAYIVIWKSSHIFST